MTTLPTRFEFTADDLIHRLEGADYLARATPALRGSWLLPVLQLLIGAAVLVARRVERANHGW